MIESTIARDRQYSVGRPKHETNINSYLCAIRRDPRAWGPGSAQSKFKNDRVETREPTRSRARSKIKPGDKEATHSHPAYVIYVIAGGKFRNHAADGTVSDGEFKTGDVIYRDPVTHWAENIGDTTIRLVLVELKN
jgi:quercetin dioxygenase-like cupin family protein